MYNVTSDNSTTKHYEQKEAFRKGLNYKNSDIRSTFQPLNAIIRLQFRSFKPNNFSSVRGGGGYYVKLETNYLQCCKCCLLLENKFSFILKVSTETRRITLFCVFFMIWFAKFVDLLVFYLIAIYLDNFSQRSSWWNLPTKQELLVLQANLSFQVILGYTNLLIFYKPLFSSQANNP